MTRAERLRAAAGRMRATGKAAMDPPWAVDEDGTAVFSAQVAPYGAPCVVPHACEEDAEWIVMVHPGLARPLPDLLEVVADLIDAHHVLEHQHVDGEPCDDLACQIVHHALAVADTLGGEA